MAGYNFVEGVLKKFDDAVFGNAQVYMSDAEYASRGASVKITGPAAPTIASSGGGPAATTVMSKKGMPTSTAFGKGTDAFGFKTGVNEKAIPGVYTNRWGDAVQDMQGNYRVNGAATSASQVNDIYNAGQKPAAPVVPDTPAMQPSQPVSESVAQAVPTIAQPTKSDPLVQAAGTTEVKKIQDTYGRQDTIVSEPDSKIYKVRAGYRRKTKLGS